MSIIKIERCSVFEAGTMESHYEVRSYERLTNIGVLVGGKTLKKCKTFDQALDYCGKHKLFVEP